MKVNRCTKILVAVKHGICTVRVIDQVKAYKPDNPVPANDVRALMGVLQNDPASKDCLSTTGIFAPGIESDPLITPFIPQRLELVPGVKLYKRLESIAAKTKA